MALTFLLAALLSDLGRSLPRPFRTSGSPFTHRYNSLQSLVGYWAVLWVPALGLVWALRAL